MQHANLKLMLAAIGSLALWGCGGSGGGATSHNPNVIASTRLDFTGGSGFNGTTTTLTSGNATTSVSGAQTTASVTANGRSLNIVLPASSVYSGDSFQVGGQGATVSYSETINGANATWVATSGTITVQSGLSGLSSGNIRLSNLTFAPQSGPAAGSFTLNGTIGGITVLAPVSGSNASLAFSSLSGANIDGTAIDGASNVTMTNTGSSTLVVVNGGGNRLFRLNLGSSVTAGQSIALSGPTNGVASIQFTQPNGPSLMTWWATSGSITVLQKSSTEVRVQFNNVTFSPALSGSGGATGTFVVNGTISDI